MTQLSTVLAHLASTCLDIGELLILDRYGRSITWDSQSKLLPTRVRGGAETPDERSDFARRVLSTQALEPYRPMLAVGMLAIRPGIRLRIERIESDRGIAISILATQPSRAGEGRSSVYTKDLTAEKVKQSIVDAIARLMAGSV